MRIAFLNRGRETHPGGDIIALDETMAALRRLGVECEETGWDADRIANGNFDLCHVFHCNFDWSWGNYQAIQKARKKYVLTPVFYAVDTVEFEPLLCGINFDQITEMIRGASRITPFSVLEYDNLPTAPWPDQVKIIPNGTAKEFYGYRPPFNRMLGVSTISSRGPSDKNCEKIIEACVRADLRLNVITDKTRSEVATLLQDTSVFINASESERMSLTIGEALCAGCRVMATKENWGNEWYGPGLYTFDPKESVEVLAERLRAVYYAEEWDYSPNIKARLITWDLVAAQLLQVYQEVLA